MGQPTAASSPADLVFTGGAVYTVNPQQPWASAVAIADGKIIFVGSDENAIDFVAPTTRQVELDGRMLMPGFHDSHMHPMAAGGRLLRCELKGLVWPQAVLKKLQACRALLKPGQWLRAEHLSEKAFANPSLDREPLDRLFPETPVLLREFDGRSMLLNGLALEAVGIDTRSRESMDGIIRRAQSGEPTGVLIEAAVDLAYKNLPVPSQNELRAGLARASELANKFGITSGSEAAAKPHHWSAYLAADADGELTLRVNASLRWNEEEGPGQLSRLVDLREKGRGRRFRADFIKLFLDGDAGRTASLLEPYEGTETELGESNFGDSLTELVTAIDAAGFDIHLHAYGDRAVRDGLNAIEAASRVNPDRGRKPHFAHIALIDPEDLPRFSHLGVVADIQPLWAWWNEERSLEAASFGRERAKRFLAYRDVFRSGARVVAGSDWISDSMNPLYGIQVAVTRRPPGGGAVWMPEQTVSLHEMIEAYTINGAWLAGQEELTGSVEPGKLADLIVLERNLFDVEPMKIKDVAVQLTLLEGEVIYSDGSIPLDGF